MKTLLYGGGTFAGLVLALWASLHEPILGITLICIGLIACHFIRGD